MGIGTCSEAGPGLAALSGERARVSSGEGNDRARVLTAVAATCVLGTQLLIIASAFRAAALLSIAGIILWVLLTYGIFTALIVKEKKA